MIKMAARDGSAGGSTKGIAVRHGSEADLARITEIYNHYVISSPATFDIEPLTAEESRSRLGPFSLSGPHRVVVAEAEAVVGYAASHEFRPKRAYDTTIETTVYCAPEATSRGIGRLLYSKLFETLRDADLRLAVAAITLPNDASVALHRSFGFVLSGVMHGVGRKFDRYWDVAWYEKRLD